MKIFKYILNIVLGSIFIISLGLLLKNNMQSYKEKQANIELFKRVEEKTTEDKAGKYDALHDENQDMVGWLKINGTDINYPVMYTPDKIEDYLHKGFDGNYASSGSLFLGEGWSEESNYSIIFGHNMKNGSMFASLIDFKSYEFEKTHSLIEFNTLNDERIYEVVSAFYSQVYNKQDHDSFKYYNYTDLSNEDTFNYYVSESKRASLYDTGINVSYGDRLLVLSTCSYHIKDGRFVIMAKEVNKKIT